MTTFVALLRAVNVGGTGALPMSRLKKLCEEVGFSNVRTYIASGNAVFDSKLSSRRAQAAIENALAKALGKPVRVHVRSAGELLDVLDGNPFRNHVPRKTLVHFLDEPPNAGDLAACVGISDEQLRTGKQEIYVFYPSGQGRSKLKLPSATTATSRNMATLEALIEMTRGNQDIPADFATALRSNRDANRRFAALSPSHRQEYLEWISEAKKPETRLRRIEGTIKRLIAG